MSDNNKRPLGPNHQEWCKGEVFYYSGWGYNRVKICACGAEDHAPEPNSSSPEKGITIHLVLRERYDSCNRLQESAVVKAFFSSKLSEEYLSSLQVEEVDGICYSITTMEVTE